MEYLILAVVVTIMNISAFVIGAMIGQKTKNNEQIKMPTINPITLYNEHKEKEEQSKEQKILNANLENINNYGGDEIGQKDIVV